MRPIGKKDAMLRSLALPAAAILLLAVSPLPAPAHPLAPSLLQVEDTGDGRLRVFWKTPMLRVPGSHLRPVLPADCELQGEPARRQDEGALIEEWVVRCGAGMSGATLGVDGIAASKTDVLLRVALADGRSFRQVLTAEESSFRVPQREGAVDVARGYARLGLGHVLGRLDPLLFVFGLVLLVGERRALLRTIMAFAIGHSVTLSAAVLGFVHVPPRPVAALVAFSLLLLAAELARADAAPPTIMRRSPWIMAFLFGLLHGLAFAGALAAVGLPDGDVPLALLSFNVGIEIGQLLFVAAVLLGRAALSPLIRRLPLGAARVPSYVIGTLAAFWCFERLSGSF
jgi:HupE / UreJ protein